MLESLTQAVSGSGWTYGIVLGVAALDAVFPLVPSETVLVATAALAADGELELPLVLLAAAVGAFAGDTAAYLGGRLVGPLLAPRLAARRGWRRRLVRARRQLRIRGGVIILASRFVPGGRTATMVTAGSVGLPWRRFLIWDGVAALVWAGYGTAIGYLGAAAFEDDPLRGVVLALALAFVLGGFAELVRRLVARFRHTRQGGTMNDNLMTLEGLARLADEIDDQRARRDAASDWMTTTIAGGGSRLDPGYLVARDELRLAEARLFELEERRRNAVVAEPDPNDGRVGIGEDVRVRDLGSGEVIEFRIVGRGEAQPGAGRISYRSPVGAALLGRRAGDRVEIAAPHGPVRLEVLAAS